jgi:hypothetical protein
MASPSTGEHLGSGLFVSDGAGYSSPQRAAAFPLPNGQWRAQIAGVENGVVVRSWTGPTFDRKADALGAAMAALPTQGQET